MNWVDPAGYDAGITTQLSVCVAAIRKQLTTVD